MEKVLSQGRYVKLVQRGRPPLGGPPQWLATGHQLDPGQTSLGGMGKWTTGMGQALAGMGQGLEKGWVS